MTGATKRICIQYVFIDVDLWCHCVLHESDEGVFGKHGHCVVCSDLIKREQSDMLKAWCGSGQPASTRDQMPSSNARNTNYTRAS